MFDQMNLDHLIESFKIKIENVRIRMKVRIYYRILLEYYLMDHTLLSILQVHNSLVLFHFPPHFKHFDLCFILILHFFILLLIIFLHQKFLIILKLLGLIPPIFINLNLNKYQFSIQSFLNLYHRYCYFQFALYQFQES